MAYQSKNHRKFLATSLTAAMVASAVAPAAGFAAEATKTFPDVPASHWAKDAIDYLVDKGALEGRPDGTFDPTAEITRGEAAKILSITLGLEVSEDAKASFGDLEGHWASKYVAAIEGQTEDVINGYQDGTFKPNNKITRQEMAKMIVTAYGLEANEDVTVDFSDNNSWGAEYVNTLASLGIVEGMSAGKFAPQASVTRAQTPVFVHRAEVEEVRVTPESSELQIVGVSALDDSNRFLEINFSKSVSGLETSDITVQNADTLARYGVKEVKVSSNGKTATVELYAREDATEVLDYLQDYTVKVNVDGKTLEYTFNRPAFTKQRITDVDVNDREFTTHMWSSADEAYFPVTINVPEDVEFDFYNALGREARVWFNEDQDLVDIQYSTEDVFETAVEVTKTDKEVKLLDSGEKYDLASNFEFYLDGDDDDLATKGEKYDFAKVVFNKSGDVEKIFAYDLDESILVNKVEETVIIGHDEDEIDLEDYLIVKDGKQISIEDIEQNDLVFFNGDAEEDGIAFISNQSVTGEIENVYETSFDLNDKNYSYISNDGLQAKYLNDDNDIEDLDDKAAEKLQAGGEVTVYFNWKGEVVLVKGSEGAVDSVFTSAYTTSAISAYVDARGNQRIELEVVDQNGDEKLYDFAVDSLDEIVVQTADGEEEYEVDEKSPEKRFDIKEFALANLVNDDSNASTFEEFDFVAVEDADTPDTEDVFSISHSQSLLALSVDDNGNVKGLKFFEASDTLDVELETDDTYAKTASGSYRMQNSTLIYDINTDGTFPDADDVTIYTWADLKESGTDIAEDSTVYFDEDGYVTHVVVKDLSPANTTDQTALIQRIDKNTDGEIVRLRVLINGESKLITADKLKGSSDIDVTTPLFEGSVVVLKINDANNVVTKISEVANRIVAGIVTNVNVGNKEVTVRQGDGTLTTVKLDSDGKVYDATDEDGDDFSVEAIRDIAKDDAVVIGLSAANSRFADAITLVDVEDLNKYGYADADVAPVISVTGVTNGVTYNSDDAELDIDVTVTDTSLVSQTVTLNGANITSAATSGGYTIATDGTADDEYTLVVTAKDAAGQESTTTITFEVDGTVPVVTGVTEGQTVAVGGSVYPVFNEGTATLSKDGTAPTAFTSGDEVVGAGSYVLTVTDAAGNQTVINFTIAAA